MRFFVVVSVLLWIPPSSAVTVNPPVQVSCKDESGNSVDWFVLYKAPAQRARTPLQRDVRTGLEYVYIDAKGKRVMSPGTATPYKAISDGDGVLANTLRPMLRSIRNMPPSFGFLSYSDQPPGASSRETFGHSKGVVLGDSSTGTALWLSHSTPQFPFRRDQNNFWPPNGAAKGQTFICVSLTYIALTTVGEHLKNIGAYPFDHDLPTDFHTSLQQVVRWSYSDQRQELSQGLFTVGNTQLKTLAKKAADKGAQAKVGDLYVKLTGLVSSSLGVQSWRCLSDPAMNFDEPGAHRVINVEDIRTELGQWTSSRDHSKWAVTTDVNTAWTCFGDLNRSGPQFTRYGGAVCINDQSLNTAFRAYASTMMASRKRPPPCDPADIADSTDTPGGGK